jgi:hypothetical protein
VDLMGKAKDAIIKLFRQSKLDVDQILSTYDNEFILNDFEYDLKFAYFDLELSRFRGK